MADLKLLKTRRLFASTFNFTTFGLTHMFLRLALFPIYSLLLFLLFFNAQRKDHAGINYYGLILFSMHGAYVMAAISTAYTFQTFRTRYYQEAQEDLYSGPLFLICSSLFSLPFSALSVAAGSRIIFQVTGLTMLEDWGVWFGVLLGCYLLAEHQVMALLMIVKSSITAVCASLYLTTIYIILSSGILRSSDSMPEWLLYMSYGSQPHYATAALSYRLFGEPAINCTMTAFGCKYTENHSHFAHRPSHSWDVDYNLMFTLAFPTIFSLGNILLYIMPLPAFVKAKFRE